MTSSLASQVCVCTVAASIAHGSSLHFWYSRRVLESLEGQKPRPVACSATCLRRNLRPPSHSFEQGPHFDQEASEHSLSQDSMLQASTSDVSPQGSPPNWGELDAARALLTPPPHFALQ